MLKKKPLTKILIRLSKKNLWISFGLILVSFLLPLIINVYRLNIYPDLHESIENNNQGLLIIVAFKLVLMNAIRILPVFMSSFAFIESMKDIYNRKVPKYIIAIGLAIVPLLYYLIDIGLGIHYDFGLTSVVIILAILFLVSFDLSRISIINKAISVILFLIGLQWFDIIPALSKYGFGRGEVSYDVKRTIEFLGAEQSVTFVLAMFIAFFMITAILVLKILRDQNAAIKTIEDRNQIRNELTDIKMQSLRNRTLEEMQNLVHDLRSPLTSIQALVSLSAMMTKDEQVSGYMDKINGSVDQLNMMISEILYEKKRHRILIGDLFAAILSHMSPNPDSDKIKLNNHTKKSSFKVNKIRFSRMIINLINNSISALPGGGEIEIVVREKNHHLIFEVIDNGSGMNAHTLTRIKERGFSTKGSSGLGLRYVEDVVNNHGGRLEIESSEGVGTRVKMIFEKGKIGYEENISH